MINVKLCFTSSPEKIGHEKTVRKSFRAIYSVILELPPPSSTSDVPASYGGIKSELTVF